MKIGYYLTSDHQIFTSKIQAMIYAQANNVELSWYFYDNDFSRYDWSVEPSETIDQLYDKRSRQIREEYDYVILSYSGGADSNNILESFIRQNLHIDEIVTNWSLDISEKFLDLSGKELSAWNNNSEFELNTKHRLNYIKNKCPQTKITVNDTSGILLKNFLEDNNPEWYKTKNAVLNITGLNNYNYVQFKEIRKTLDKDKKIAFVLGIDKPILFLLGNELKLCFTDSIVNMVYIDQHLKEYTNATPLLYYWDTDCKELLCKQAHLVLNVLKNNETCRQVWRSTDENLKRVVQEKILKNILYKTTWNNSFYQVNKTLGDWNSQLDYWFTKGMKDSIEYKTWLEGLQQLAPKITKFIKNGKYGPTTKTFASPLYTIGKI